MCHLMFLVLQGVSVDAVCRILRSILVLHQMSIETTMIVLCDIHIELHDTIVVTVVSKYNI